MDLLTIGDIETHLGEQLAEPEVAQVSGFIRYATALVRQRVPAVDSTDPDIVRGVLTEVVARALDTVRIGRRVKGLQYPEVNTTYDSAAGLVYLTDEEVRQLTGVTRSPLARTAFTITPG